MIVPWDEAARQAIRGLTFAENVRGLARQLQPYTVQVPRSAFDGLRAAGAIQPAAQARWGDQFMVLVNDNLYDPRFGLYWEDPTFINPSQLVL